MPLKANDPWNALVYALVVLLFDQLSTAARRFLALGDRWHVRGFSAGELVSVLFILHERVAWVLPNPVLGRLLAEDELSYLTSRDSFMEFLIAH